MQGRSGSSSVTISRAGGTSPSVGVVRAASRLCREHGVTLMVMVRPRGGDFAYSAGELRMMDDDIVSHACSGVDGVVLWLRA